ncbi:hypothetical protein tinsulaeT_14200 [Thalassotalea insulae]|uniref:NfeD-like C-terminal domain-containing protein n=1 Tax=Thalassotalea insulae TaxID=2056778 RepID=A0ABQ6GTR1_9GAMM|nr:NfeD family protein [Thalassotalea insulae]GLX78080.1 hypothetical protein tinsulaeT_14200 [Thalassotalea insulae]
MEYLLYFETWIVLALLFSCLEIFIASGILLNIGIASLLVAIGVQQQLLLTWQIALSAWCIFVIILLAILYFFSKKFFLRDQAGNNLHQELTNYGKKVKVIERIGPGSHPGKVSYQGTRWNALSDGQKLEKGSYATIICRDSFSLLVEPDK